MSSACFAGAMTDDAGASTPYEWAGGLPAFTRMTRLFYGTYVPADPLLAPLFADMADDHPERVAAWLAEVFGGPQRYSETYGGYPWMVSQHRGRRLTEEQRARWAALLYRSAQEAGLPNDPEFQSLFHAYIEWGSRLAVENSQVDADPPANLPMPHWDWTTAAGPPRRSVREEGRPAPAPAEENDAMSDPLPGPDTPVSFDAHVKGLFREQDRKSMQFAFDLWEYDDVRDHADEIAERLEDGSMPCDDPWPPERVAVFARWVEAGMPE
jgi:truncated hemoglobin YjbI